MVVVATPKKSNTSVSSEVELRRLRSRRTEVAIQRAELELQEQAGKLCSVEAVERKWAAIVTMVRDRLLGITVELAQRGRPDDYVREVEQLLLEGLEGLAGSEADEQG
jgi:hypothetical protein